MCLLFYMHLCHRMELRGWGSTFLVEPSTCRPSLPPALSCFSTSAWRSEDFLSGMLAAKLHSWTIIKFSQILLGVALALFFIPGRWEISAAALFLAGLSNGPFFPNFNFLTPESFRKRRFPLGHERSNGGGLCWNPFRSRSLRAVSQAFGMGIFPYFISFFYIIMVPLTVFTKKTHSKNREKHHDKAADI